MFRIEINAQTCPVFDKRNNGNGLSSNCHPSDPSNYGIYSVKTGHFTFSSSSYSFNVLKVYRNNVLIQDGNSLLNGSTTFFGGINVSGSSSILCFYGTSGSGGAAPAGNYSFEIKTGSTTLTCPYAITNTNGGGLASTTPGSIGSDQTICSGSTPSTLTSVSDATSYSSYKWQSSTTSSSSGFADIPGATSSTYSPGSLTQTTYFQRLALDASTPPIEYASNLVTITVPTITSPTIGQTWSGSSVTFTSNVGGAWSISALSPSGSATITSGGVLTATAACSGTVQYVSTSPSCTLTRNFNFYNTSGSLPVTWETVSAQKQNGQVLLNWSTASEQNTKDFEVQYSTNTTNWDVLGTVQAAGNSSTTRNYSYTHQSPLKNSTYNYYRVLQRDLDGKFSYSKIVSIIFNEPGPDFLVYPNPADKLVTIYLAEASEVSLINSAGSVVWRSKLSAGRNQLPLEKYSSGVYYIRTKTGSQRLVIQ